jgi:hypothetical protein
VSWQYATHVPVYDLNAAAPPKTMEPLIPDGYWWLFRPWPAGSREGWIVLVQFASLGAEENGGRFTVKKYHSEKTVTADGWRHDRIQLLPLNPAFEPITLEPEDAGDLIIVGEFATVVVPGVARRL